MGRWDEGIMDSDKTLDFLLPFEADLIHRIVFRLADELLSGEDRVTPSYGTEPVVAAVEILCLFCEHSHIGFSSYLRTVRRWREVCLERFEADTTWDDCLTPDGLDARVERRKVIEATFDRLERLTDDD